MRSSTILPSHARREHEFQKNARESVEHTILHLHSLKYKVTLNSILTHTTYSKRTVQRVLASLSYRGILQKQKQTSTDGVCLSSTYTHYQSQQLAQRQPSLQKQGHRPMSYVKQIAHTTEQLSQCQELAQSARTHSRDIRSNNIYIYNNNPLSTTLESINHAREGQTSGQGDYKLYNNKKTGRTMPWDEGRVAFYRLFFEFLKEGKSYIRCDIDYNSGSEEHGIAGTICEDLEIATRAAWRQYMRSHKLKLDQFRTRLFSLAALISSGKAFQCKGLDGISLHRLMIQRGLFSTMMEEAIGFYAPTISEPISKTDISSPKGDEKPHHFSAHQEPSQEELHHAMVGLYSKLGMDPSFILQNLGIT